MTIDVLLGPKDATDYTVDNIDLLLLIYFLSVASGCHFYMRVLGDFLTKRRPLSVTSWVLPKCTADKFW